MKKSPFYITPGYVATPMELVVVVFLSTDVRSWCDDVE